MYRVASSLSPSVNPACTLLWQLPSVTRTTVLALFNGNNPRVEHYTMTKASLDYSDLVWDKTPSEESRLEQPKRSVQQVISAYLQTLANNYRYWPLLEKYKYFRYLVLKKTPVRSRSRANSWILKVDEVLY